MACAQMQISGSFHELAKLPSPDGLLILLTLARLGRFNAVAESLGTTHTTISRRIFAPDRQLRGRSLEGSPHGWELTEPGASAVAAAEAIEETPGSLAGTIGLYASPAYAALHGLPETPDGVGQHGFVSYVATSMFAQLRSARVQAVIAGLRKRWPRGRTC